MSWLLFISLYYIWRAINLSLFTTLLWWWVFMMFKFFLYLWSYLCNFTFPSTLDELAFFISIFDDTIFTFKPWYWCSDICTDHIKLIIGIYFEGVANIFVIAYFFIILLWNRGDRLWAMKFLLFEFFILLRYSNKFEL
jgi:hypothetical protein